MERAYIPSAARWDRHDRFGSGARRALCGDHLRMQSTPEGTCGSDSPRRAAASNRSGDVPWSGTSGRGRHPGGSRWHVRIRQVLHRIGCFHQTDRRDRDRAHHRWRRAGWIPRGIHARVSRRAFRSNDSAEILIPSPPVSASVRVLIADDQRDVVEALRLLLKAEAYQTDTANSPAAVLKAGERREYDVVLIDLNYARDTTSGEEGLDLLARLRSIDDTLPVVVMTPWASVSLAVEAMRRGACDFIEKPWNNERVLSIFLTQTELGRAVRRTRRLEAQNRLQGEAAPSLIAQSAAMRPVLEVIAKVGPSDANVLITGENGTGERLVAQALHSASRRSTQIGRASCRERV